MSKITAGYYGICCNKLIIFRFFYSFIIKNAAISPQNAPDIVLSQLCSA